MPAENLAQLLNFPDDKIPEDWNLSYGLTSKRASSLDVSITGVNSILNPASETALTLFMLGNTDCWSQFNILRQTPRNKNLKWNNKLFASNIKDLFISPKRSTLWSDVFQGTSPYTVNKLSEFDYDHSVLYFEFEIMNSKFNSQGGSIFKNLSFVNINQLSKWSCFDAALFLPGDKAIVFFEAKLSSDFSPNTARFELINQLYRNLESMYFLTHDRNSKYFGWRAYYVFICPERLFKYKSTYYSYLLNKMNFQDTLKAYENILKQVYKEDLIKENMGKFPDFIRYALESTMVIHWNHIYDIQKSRAGWNYSNSISGNKYEKNIRKRFAKAGIPVL